MRRRLFTALVIAVAALTVGLVSVLSILNTSFGQHVLAAKIAHSLSTPTTQVEITGVSGSTYGAIHIAALRARDHAGAWLSVSDIDLDWRPWDLLSGQFHVSRLSVGEIVLERLPTTQTDAPSKPFGVAKLPIGVRVGEIALPSIVLGEAVLGEKMAFGISGHVASDRDGGLSTVLQMAALQDTGTSLSLDAKVGANRQTLSLRLDMSEPEGGLIGRLLSIEDAPAMTLSVLGDGPLSAWPGTFEFAAGSITTQPDARVTGRLAANLNDDPRLRLTGQAQVAAVFAQPIDFDLATRFDADTWSGHIDDLALSATGWQVGGNVALQFETLAVAGHLEGNVTQALALPNDLSLDAGHATIELAGSATAPELAMTGTLQAPRVQNFSAREIDFSAHLETPRSDMGAPFQVHATFDTPRTGDTMTDALLNSGVGLDAHGYAFANTGHVALDGLTITGQAFSVHGEGQLDYVAMTGQMSIDIDVPDPARLKLAGFEHMQGHVRIHADAQANVRGGLDTLHAPWRATVVQPKTGITSLDPWFGSELEAAGVLSTRDGTAWRIDTVTLQSGSVALAGDAQLTLPTTHSKGNIEARFTGEIETVSPLGTSLGMATEGRARLNGRVSGRLANPDVTIRLQVAGPRVGPVHGDSAEMNIDARTVLSAPTGEADIRIAFGGDMVSATSGFSVHPGQDIRFPDLRLQAGGGSAAGQLVWMIPRGGATAKVSVEKINLHSLGRIAGMDVSGTVDGTLTLDHVDGKQRMDGHINAQNFNFPQHGVRVARIDLRTDARHDTDALTFNSVAKLSGVVTPYGAMDTAEIDVQGTPSRVDVALQAQGPEQDVERLSVKAQVTHSDDIWTANIANFDGRVRSVAIALKQPARLSYAREHMSIECLTLTVAGGNARACIDLTPQQVDGSLMLTQLPLTTFAPWVPADMDWPKTAQDGMINLDLTVQGMAQKPTVNFVLGIDDVRLSTEDDVLETMNMKATGAFTNGQFTVKADLFGPGDTRGDMTARVPGTFSVSPFVAAINDSEPLEAELRLNGALDGVQRFLPLDPHRIFGVVNAHVAARGSLSQLQWSGTARLDQGRYENLKTGTVLKNIEADLQGSGDTLSLRNLRATDGDAGTVEGRGTILLTHLYQPTLDIALSLKHLYVVRRDDLTAVATGDVNISGAATAPHIGGELTLSPVEIRIPDTLPTEVVDLTITQVVGESANASAGLIGPAKLRPQQTDGPSLDMLVDIPGRMFLRGRGLTSEWAGRFKVVQRDGLLQIEGALRPVRGEYQFAGKAFRLTEGSVTFLNGDEPVLALNLTAEYTRREFKAIMHLGGTANAPEITLSSVPQLPQDEIIARVLFGRNTGQLNAFEAAQLAQAAGQLSGIQSFSGGGLDAVRKAIGTDVLRFEGGDAGQGASATAGKYVRDDIYVGVKQGTTPNSTGATVEIELTPSITLDSEVHQDSSTHVGIKWKWDY